MRISLIILIIAWIPVQSLQAQSLDRFVIGSSGSFVSNATHQIEFTVGETVITTIENGTVLLNQGFNQSKPPYNTALDPEAVGVNYLLYPNPTTGKIVLELESPLPVEIRLKVWDVLGRKTDLATETRSFSGKTIIELDLSSFTEGFYLLRFSDLDGTFMKTLRVEKRS